MPTTIGTNSRTAIDRCLACATACDICASACLGEDHSESREECIRKCLDCSLVCRATATLLARGADIGPDMCRVCIESCLRCETECRHHHDESCKECAAACNSCTDALRAIS